MRKNSVCIGIGTRRMSYKRELVPLGLFLDD